MGGGDAKQKKGERLDNGKPKNKEEKNQFFPTTSWGRGLAILMKKYNGIEEGKVNRRVRDKLGIFPQKNLLETKGETPCNTREPSNQPGRGEGGPLITEFPRFKERKDL